jgi:hypothetical protein
MVCDIRFLLFSFCSSFSSSELLSLRRVPARGGVGGLGSRITDLGLYFGNEDVTFPLGRNEVERVIVTWVGGSAGSPGAAESSEDVTAGLGNAEDRLV